MLIEKIESELEDCSNDLAQIVSIESGNESNSSAENNQAPVNKLPDLTLSNSGRINNQVSDLLPDFATEDRTVDDTDTQDHNKAYQKYPPRQYYYGRSPYQDNRRLNSNGAPST